MPEIQIRDDLGRALDARVEIQGQDLTLHSRSGSGSTARNPDYRGALMLILARLAARDRRPDVFLDSRNVQQLPLEERLLASATELSGSEVDQFNLLVRLMNRDRLSNGAWSRILLRVPGEPSSIGAIVSGSASATTNGNRPERLPNEEQRRVTAEAVHVAVASLLGGNDAPNFAESRDYDVVTEGGDRLAPKKVFGRALEIAGVVAEASPYHFSAGWSQPCFEILQMAGYDIIRKADAEKEAARRKVRSARSTAEVDRMVATVEMDPVERSWIEGDKRMAVHLRLERKRSAKAAAAKRAEVRAANNGLLTCDHCSTDWYEVYGHAVAEAIFDVHHTVPLKDMDDGHETKVEDLLCLCANCHRAAHRRLLIGA